MPRQVAITRYIIYFSLLLAFSPLLTRSEPPPIRSPYGPRHSSNLSSLAVATPDPSAKTASRLERPSISQTWPLSTHTEYDRRTIVKLPHAWLSPNRRVSNQKKIRYSVVDCNDCRPSVHQTTLEYAHEDVCFIVQGVKRQKIEATGLYTVDVPRLHLKRASTFGDCYRGYSSFVYTYEPVRYPPYTNATSHVAPSFLPLERDTSRTQRRPESRSARWRKKWSSSWIARRIFGVMPVSIDAPFDHLHATINLDMQPELTYVPSPAEIFRWAKVITGVQQQSVAHHARLEVAQSFMNGSFESIFASIASGHGANHFMANITTFVPINQLQEAIAHVYAWQKPTVSMYIRFEDELRFRQRAHVDLYLYALVADDVLTDQSDIAKTAAIWRHTIISRRDEVSNIIRKKPNAMSEYCRFLYHSIQLVSIFFTAKHITMSVFAVKYMLLAPPVALLGAMPTHALQMTAHLPPSSFWEEYCGPINDTECQLGVASIAEQQTLLQDLLRQLDMYLQTIHQSASGLSDGLNFLPTLIEASSDTSSAGSVRAAKNMKLLHERVAERAAALELPPRQSDDAREFFQRWTTNARQFVRLSSRDITVAKLRAVVVGVLFTALMFVIALPLLATLSGNPGQVRPIPQTPRFVRARNTFRPSGTVLPAGSAALASKLPVADPCTICYEPLRTDKDVYSALCGHMLHNACFDTLKNWSGNRGGPSCPMCRGPM